MNTNNMNSYEINKYKRDHKIYGNFYTRYIDKSIRKLIIEINSHPDFVTTSSCSGHFRVCVPKIKKNKICKILSADDCLNMQSLYNDLSSIMTIDEYININGDEYDLFCPDSSSPYLQFYCTPDYSEFIQYLKKGSECNKCTVIDNEICYSYGKISDERYTFDLACTDQCNPLTGFKQFWEFFVVGWKLYVNPNYSGTIPSKFELNKKCDVCDIFLPVHSNEPIKSKCYGFLETELFSEKWIDILMRNSFDERFM